MHQTEKKVQQSYRLSCHLIIIQLTWHYRGFDCHKSLCKVRNTTRKIMAIIEKVSNKQAKPARPAHSSKRIAINAPIFQTRLYFEIQAIIIPCCLMRSQVPSLLALLF